MMSIEERRDSYVYLHERKDNGVVFYIGSGRGNRTNDKHGRPRDWLVVVNEAGGYNTIKLAENLSKSEAIDLEYRYISEPHEDWVLVNKSLPRKTVELDYNTFSEYFYCDASSPSGLRYNKDIHRVGDIFSKRRHDIAGTKHCVDGKVIAWRVSPRINGVRRGYKVHRIIWLLQYKQIDSLMVVDHIDNDPTNNNLSNLRLVSQHVNGRNKLPGKVSESTDIVGIIEREGNYLAQLRDVTGKRIAKSFSINKYGKTVALYLAVKSRYNYLISQEDSMKFTDSHSCMDKLLKIITDFEMSQGEYLGIEPTRFLGGD